MMVRVGTVLEIEYFGEVSASWRGEAIRPASKKTFAMLVYLAASGAGVNRDHLAELLWGSSEKRANVRQALYELRKEPGADAWLVDDGDMLLIRSEHTFQALRAGLESGARHVTPSHVPNAFAAGFDKVSDAFDDWLQEQRTRLEQSINIAITRALEEAEQREDHEKALGLVKHLLELTPYDESLYQRALRHSAQSGDSSGLIAWYQRAERVFKDELKGELSPKTTALYEKLRSSVTLLMRQLQPDELALVQLLFLASGELTVEQCAQALDVSSFDLAETLDSLHRRGIIRDGFVVTPEIAGELEKRLSWSRKSLLHERVLAVLPAHVSPVVRAKHLLGSNQPGQAAPHLLQAGKDAIQANDHERAEQLLFRALWAADSARMRLRALINLEGMVALRVDDALHEVVLKEAEKLAWDEQDDEYLAQVRLRRSRSLIRRRAFGEALENALEALEIALRINDEGLTVQARNAIGGVHYYLGDLEGALASFSPNLEATAVTDRYSALNNVGLITAQLGQRDESLKYFDEALTLARQTERQPDIISTLNNLAATAERFAAYGRAAKSMLEALTLARKVGAEDLEARLQLNLVIVLMRQGELGPAWNTLQEVEDAIGATAEIAQRVKILELKADLAQVTGAREPALAYLQEAIDLGAGETADRHRIILEAVVHLVRYRLGEIGPADVVGAIQSLEAAQVSDLPNWLWIELSWFEPNETRAAEFLAHVTEAELNAHQRVLYAAKKLHRANTAGEREQWLASVQESAAVLGAPMELSGNTPGPIVEWPIIAAIIEYAASGELNNEFLSAFEDAVADQAQGLPKAVAKRYREYRSRLLREFIPER